MASKTNLALTAAEWGSDALRMLAEMKKELERVDALDPKAMANEEFMAQQEQLNALRMRYSNKTKALLLLRRLWRQREAESEWTKASDLRRSSDAVLDEMFAEREETNYEFSKPPKWKDDEVTDFLEQLRDIPAKHITEVRRSLGSIRDRLHQCLGTRSNKSEERRSLPDATTGRIESIKAYQKLISPIEPLLDPEWDEFCFEEDIERGRSVLITAVKGSHTEWAKLAFSVHEDLGFEREIIEIGENDDEALRAHLAHLKQDLNAKSPTHITIPVPFEQLELRTILDEEGFQEIYRTKRAKQRTCVMQFRYR